jgi:hypothetical protein
VDRLARLEHGDELGESPLWLSYAASQRPSAFARSTSASPESFILPSAIRRSAVSRLIRDHLLRGRLGVKRWRKCASSSASRRPSIHPKQIALSSTSG